MRARPYHWFTLNAPFGATSGFVAVMLGYLGNDVALAFDILDDEAAVVAHVERAIGARGQPVGATAGVGDE